MSDQQTIKETLNVIRKALEDENHSNSDEVNEKILILDQLVKEDGTINTIKSDFLYNS